MRSYYEVYIPFYGIFYRSIESTNSPILAYWQLPSNARIIKY